MHVVSIHCGDLAAVASLVRFHCASGKLFYLLEFVHKFIELGVVREAESVDEIQLKVNPLSEFLRRFGESHFWRDNAVYKSLIINN